MSDAVPPQGAGVAKHNTRGIFISGTDTGVGKTWVAVALLRRLVASGVRAVGMKPVAAGISSGARVNADVGALLAAGYVASPPPHGNPVLLAPPAPSPLSPPQGG